MKESVGCGRRHLALAVDTKDLCAAVELVNEVKDYISMVKLGLEFFIANGPQGVQKLHQETGVSIFLDLKLFDIPNTVRSAVEGVLAMSCVSMLTVHLSGGSHMVNYAVEASATSSLVLVGVAILTSSFPTKRSVLRLVNEAYGCGLRAIVCSPHEVAYVKKIHSDMVTIVPGVRSIGSDRHDQYRVDTPSQAVKNGADILIVGREITGSKDRRGAAQRILAEVGGVFDAKSGMLIY